MSGCLYDKGELPLSEPFVIVNLGAHSDPALNLPAEFRKMITLVEVDAASEAKSGHGYARKIVIDRVISGRPERRRFVQRKASSSSSLLDPDEDLVTTYGLEEYYREAKSSMVDCVTLPGLLDENGIAHVDFLKTDVEGMDYDVLRSCERLLDRVLLVQSELRFQPFYKGEPVFHEVAAFLHSKGFSLIDLKTQFWKPRTSHWAEHNDGRIVWGDFVFWNGRAPWDRDTAVKLILLLSLIGKRSLAEYILEKHRGVLGEKWAAALTPLTVPLPPPRPGLLRRVKRRIWRLWTPPPAPSEFPLTHVAPERGTIG